MTSRSCDTRAGCWGLLLAALTAVLITLFGTGTASAATATTAQTRVGASMPAAAFVVGPRDGIGAGQRLGNDPLAYDFVLVTGVAAKSASGARFAVDSAGEATLWLRAGSSSLEVTEHAALRMTQRGISIDAADATLAQQPFKYFHQDVSKTGYYDPSSKLFLGSVSGRVTTVIDKASPKYILNLQAATP